MSIPFINGIAAGPTAAVSRWGDRVIISEAADDHRVEDLARAIAVASGGVVWVATGGLLAPEVKPASIAGNVSQSILFGRTVREAVEQARDPIDALVELANGYELFRGTVKKCEGGGNRGFTWWDVELEGTGDY